MENEPRGERHPGPSTSDYIKAALAGAWLWSLLIAVAVHLVMGGNPWIALVGAIALFFPGNLLMLRAQHCKPPEKIIIWDISKNIATILITIAGALIISTWSLPEANTILFFILAGLQFALLQLSLNQIYRQRRKGQFGGH